MKEMCLRRVRIRLYGIVQGIGFRPFVSRLAQELHIAGDVCNKGSYVEIHAESDPETLGVFRRRLVDDAPRVSAIIRVETQEEIPVGADSFTIRASRSEAGDIFVSPDLATCDKCREELFDPENRRYLHPFINCTDCGPRLTILDSMPYDRVRTSMAEFPMCRQCEYEYTHSETRRYHAQPVCCNDDGPVLFIPGRGEMKGDALIYTRRVIRGGGIAAIKGIGGFHLCCDARNARAVARLRELKNRPQKPFAVMMRDLETVKKECILAAGQEKMMTGVQKPILLLERKKDSALPDVLAPDNPYLGVMLPYAPVQMLLFDYPDKEPMTDVLVMTSGNPGGAPICRTTEEAVRFLGPMCDVILSNDRKIRLRADDSVMQTVFGKPYMIRRSRGFAPLPVKGPENWKGQILAVGGELKNTFVLAKNEWYYPSPYIGDLADLRSVEALGSAVRRMERLLEIAPQAAACDLHPKYNSTAFAGETQLPLIFVQHHYAHVLSCMAENEIRDPVIGVSFDGTGYGSDGTIWGGEFLIADPSGFTRIGSLAPFAQAGGDASAREGWRIAVALLRSCFGGDALPVMERLGLADGKNLRAQCGMLEHGFNTVESTSAGRLFDAVSSILGIRNCSTFEGEASMALEFAAKRYEEEIPGGPDRIRWEKLPGGPARIRWEELFAVRPYDAEHASVHPKPVGGDSGRERSFVIRTEELVRLLAEQRLAGDDPERLAWIFHRAAAEFILAGAVRCREQTGIASVALSGGVFQNLLLLRMTKELLEGNGFRVLNHSLIPPNDGGIAVGQAYAAMAWLNGR
jgi:hydrogenase maturation protein HypF